MKIYQVHYRDTFDESKGYRYFEKAADAKQSMDEKDTIDLIKIEVSKEGLLKALNKYASHPDNG